MWKYIVSGLMLALTILFCCLQSLWVGFCYFALAFGAGLSLLWTILWIVDYFVSYKRESLEEQYTLYKAQLVNSSSLSLDQIKKADKYFYKKFKKTLIKEKCIQWLKIICAVGIFIALFFIFIR